MTMRHDTANPPPRKRRPNLTPDEKSQIVLLREKGWGLDRLAEKFECHVGSISWCCLMAGISAPRSAPRKYITYANFAGEYTRNGKPVRRFSPEEDKIIQDMRERGDSLAEIGRVTGRRHNSILGRLCSLARRAEAGEEA